jgi:nitroimidazol reductase NimA-like FMN-containing flavoprotein (pyridoxamine 5'-phosphate oxidase superfamily)
VSTTTTRIRRHPERAREGRGDLDAVLDAGHHVGALSTVVDGRPWVVPMLYARVGDQLLLHGSTGAGALRRVAAGAPAALSVTHIDGWVFAHTMFDASANYRSAVVHGHLRNVPQESAGAALTQLVEIITPGRSAETPPHTRKHLASTATITMDIVPGQWTVKVRDAEPSEPEPGEDHDPTLWTGLLPITSVYGPPTTASRLPPDTPVSASVLAMMRNQPPHL